MQQKMIAILTESSHSQSIRNFSIRILLTLSLLGLMVWHIHQQGLQAAYSLWEYIETHSDDKSQKETVQEKMEQLIALNKPELIPLMTKAIIDNSGFESRSQIPENAAYILVRYQHPKATEALFSLMNPPPVDGPIMGYAHVTAYALASQGPSAIPVFADFLKNQSESSLGLIVGLQGLGLIRSAEATPILLNYIDTSYSTFVRRAAIGSLGWNGDPSAIESLQKIIDADEDPLVRSQAQDAVLALH